MQQMHNRFNQTGHNKNCMKDTDLCLLLLDFIAGRKTILNRFRLPMKQLVVGF